MATTFYFIGPVAPLVSAAVFSASENLDIASELRPSFKGQGISFDVRAIL